MSLLSWLTGSKMTPKETAPDPAVVAACKLAMQFEGLRLEPYADPVGIPTIGYGSTTYMDGRKVTLQDPAITKEQAMSLLYQKMEGFMKSVDACVEVPLNPNQAGALCDFTYNLGPVALEESTLLKDLNANNYAKAAHQLLVWDMAGGQVMDGLEDRREAELTLFNTPYKKE